MTRGTRPRTRALLGALLLSVVVAAAIAVAPAASKPQAVAGRLDFRVTLKQSGPFSIPCPVFLPSEESACIPFTVWTSVVRGLGNISANGVWALGIGPPACPAGLAKPITTFSPLFVAGKGTIGFTFAEAAHCVPFEDGSAWWPPEPQEFTITGGTGRFAAASGEGTRVHTSVPGFPATETWMGTLELSGHTFDMTAPKLHGADSRTVRTPKGAKSAPVTFRVTATDGADGAVPVSCLPRSGSYFRIGKTTVECFAADTSGNSARAAFTVTVKRQR